MEVRLTSEQLAAINWVYSRVYNRRPLTEELVSLGFSMLNDDTILFDTQGSDGNPLKFRIEVEDFPPADQPEPEPEPKRALG